MVVTQLFVGKERCVTTRIKAAKETTKKVKRVMKKTAGIVSRKEQTIVLKFHKTRLKEKAGIGLYRSSNIYFYATKICL